MMMMKTYLEIVRASTQELVTDVKRFTALDPAEEPLTGQNTPRLVTDIYKDIVATCKC